MDRMNDKENMQQSIKRAIRPNSRRSIESHWGEFCKWCNSQAIKPMAATTKEIALYVEHHIDTLKPTTLKNRLWAIGRKTQKTNIASTPVVRDALNGALLYASKEKRAAPITFDTLRCIHASPMQSHAFVRDWALLLVGFWCAARRDALANIMIDDLEWGANTLEVRLRSTKESRDGRRIILSKRDDDLCAISALERWVAFALIKQGRVFLGIDRHGNIGSGLTPQSVNLIIKRNIERAGLDPNMYSGHSLRSGFVTQAAMSGVSDAAIMAITGHKSIKQVSEYIRDRQATRTSICDLM